eukprot:scaffold234604_cov35-Tisochrysis_lutea.AAC.2
MGTRRQKHPQVEESSEYKTPPASHLHFRRPSVRVRGGEKRPREYKPKEGESGASRGEKSSSRVEKSTSKRREERVKGKEARRRGEREREVAGNGWCSLRPLSSPLSLLTAPLSCPRRLAGGC